MVGSRSSASLPIIDITPLVRLDELIADGSFGLHHLQNEQLKAVAEQISHAVETVGFFAVTHHGVDLSIVKDALDESKNFFDLEPKIKGSVSMTNTYPYGYENYESLGIKRSATSADGIDSKETFSIGPQNSTKSGMPPRQFPQDAPDTFSLALTTYFDIMEHLARILYRGFALALQLEDVNWFLREGIFDDGHQCALRILNYPSIKYRKSSEDRSKVHIRAGAHTDYGAMTILKSGGPGLQLNLSPKTADDESSWFDVPHIPDAFIINLGDLMQRWTNDRWMSTLHRVIAVADGDSSDKDDDGVFESARRQSIAFFVNINGRATILPFDSCVNEEHPSQYEAITASEYLIRRHAQSMGMK